MIGTEENLYDKVNINKGVERIRSLAADRKALEEMREYFYGRYLDNYTEDRYIERHIELYDEYAG